MGVGGRHAPAALPPGKRPGTHCIGGWVGPRAVLDGCGKSRHPTGIRSPDRPARSESPYRLSYPGPRLTEVHVCNVAYFIYLVLLHNLDILIAQYVNVGPLTRKWVSPIPVALGLRHGCVAVACWDCGLECRRCHECPSLM